MPAAERCAYVVTRASLRSLLGSEIGVSPVEIEFTCNAWGKPSLAPAHGRARLDFSVSHTRGLSVIAIAQDARVGVDVERRRHVPDSLRIAADVFGEGVARRLGAVPDEGRDDVFLRLWTAGEASVKASGLGLAGTGGPIALCLAHDHAPRLGGENDVDSDEGGRRRLVPLALPVGHVGNIVAHFDGADRPAACPVELGCLALPAPAMC
ncbi:MAG: 4'-phosphopantetheinyl transferase superfamily protein [Proteobacteria bacterium]|nr:4'-phosphopantetheinyl transferase superfamily protein [Pseudomonadota bacterium]